MQISRVSQLSLVFALMMMIYNSTFAQRVTTDFDRSTDFTQFTTFMWMKEPSTRIRSRGIESWAVSTAPWPFGN